MSDKVIRSEIRPVPTDEELAAILAAIDQVWPRPEDQSPAEDTPATTRWRFAGRWWTKPTPVHRSRP
jgi:hypothetical protein